VEEIVLRATKELGPVVGLLVSMLLAAVLALWRRYDKREKILETRMAEDRTALRLELATERASREQERNGLLAKCEQAELRSLKTLSDSVMEARSFLEALELEQRQSSDLERQLDSARSEIASLRAELERAQTDDMASTQTRSKRS
jgi:DNA repair exonuclease SbcCD ATPase subunit